MSMKDNKGLFGAGLFEVMFQIVYTPSQFFSIPPPPPPPPQKGVGWKMKTRQKKDRQTEIEKAKRDRKER